MCASGLWQVGDLNYSDPSCSAPMREYIWLDWVVSSLDSVVSSLFLAFLVSSGCLSYTDFSNTKHPTFTVHRHVANLIVKTMGL